MKQIKTIENLFFLGIVLLIFSGVVTAESQELGKVVFERAVIPFTNITILDDTFSVLTTANHPEKLILLNKNNRYIIEVNDPLETKDYHFKILWRRFNDSKTGITDSFGTPIYGTYHKDFGQIDSYLLRVYLRKPVLEIGHTVNSIFKNSFTNT